MVGEVSFFIDQAGLVIMRHMVGEVSFFTLLSFSEMETKPNVRRGCQARMLGANRMVGAYVRRTKYVRRDTLCSALPVKNVRRK